LHKSTVLLAVESGRQKYLGLIGDKDTVVVENGVSEVKASRKEVGVLD